MLVVGMRAWLVWLFEIHHTGEICNRVGNGAGFSRLVVVSIGRNHADLKITCRACVRKGEALIGAGFLVR